VRITTIQRRLWLNDGSCVRLRPERANHVWSYDFVSSLTHDGRILRLLTLIDEFTREGLAIRVARRLGSQEVIETLAEMIMCRGIPEHLRSDNGPEFIAQKLRKWLGSLGAVTLYRASSSCDLMHRGLWVPGGREELFFPSARAGQLGLSLPQIPPHFRSRDAARPQRAAQSVVDRDVAHDDRANFAAQA